MRSRPLFFLIALICFASPAATHGAIITYDGSSTPNSATYGPTFTTVLFGNTDWSSDGDVLTMSTAPGEGIWFGWANYVGDYPGFSFGSDLDGNRITLRARLPVGTNEWNMYFYDASYFAAFYLLDTGVEYSYATSGGAYASATYALDATAFHDYEFLLKDGHVTYRVDGPTIFSGHAYPSGFGPLLVIGDASAYGGTGYGGFQIDGLSIDTAPVPEPASVVPAALGMTILLVRKGRRRRAA